MRSWARRHWRWAAPAGVVVAAAGAWLVFGYFAFHLIFVDDAVDEDMPLFASGAAIVVPDAPTQANGAGDAVDPPVSPDGSQAPSGSGEAADSSARPDGSPDDGSGGEPGPATTTVAGQQAPEPQESAQTDAASEPDPAPAASDDSPATTVPPAAPDDQPAPLEPDPAPAASDDSPATTAPPAPAPEPEPEPADPAPAEPSEPVVAIEASGSFVNRSHPTSGTAAVLGDGSGQRFLRFEDFRTDNGPDLNVYLSAAPPDASAGAFDDDYVDLGDLKGNVGSQNYEIPVEVDLSHYSTVTIWCVRFSVVFGVADLA